MKMFAIAFAAALVLPTFAFAQHEHGSAPAHDTTAAPTQGAAKKADAKTETHETTKTETTHTDTKMKKKGSDKK